MALQPGIRLGSYEVISAIGVGGMGEVYRARDTSLNRDVAIKVLPEAVAADTDRLARFQREAEALAALNHPNIAQIYGLEQSGGTPAIVMELVEGPTLADRIERGPIPLDKALPVARQIAEALEAAHERGIVHRDLKPANVKVKDDGTVKVLDFGLAKAVEPPGGSGENTANSPTITSPAVTEMGIILGTAAYMSPEQARGRSVDKRADVWAFGCVLYEMLTGRRAFEGDTVTDLLVAVMSQEPNWTPLAEAGPPHVVRLVRRCLERESRRRLRDLGDALPDLSAEADWPPGTVANPLIAVGRRRPGLAWFVPAIAVGLLIGWISSTWIGPQEATASPPTITSSIAIEDQALLAIGTRTAAIGYDSPVVALSRDGRQLVYVARTDTGTSLRLREMRTGATTTLPGTDGAIHAVFSPDGQSLAFLTVDRVKRLDLSGGGPITLCEAEAPVLVWWPDPDTIYFTEVETWTLSKVSSRSPEVGRPAVAGTPPTLVSFSDVLPGGRRALAIDRTGGIGGDYLTVAAVDLATGDLSPLGLSGYGARLVEPDRLIFGRAGSLFTVTVDPDTLRITGAEQFVASNVAMDSFFFQVQATASGTGVLVFAPGGDLAVGRLAWVDRVDRGGNVTYLPESPRLFGALGLSPDGRRIAVHVGDAQDHVDIISGSDSFSVAVNDPLGWPIWHPDGKRIAAMEATGDRGAPRAFRVFEPQQPEIASVVTLSQLTVGGPRAWSPTEDVLAVSYFDTAWRTMVLREGEAITEFHGLFPNFSPDGRFIAYSASQGTKTHEVYIRSYPEGTVSAPFSLEGGVEPLWNHATEELFYRRGAQWFGARVRTPDLSWEPVELVFDTDFIDTPGMSYAVSPDGQRLLIVKRAEPVAKDRLHVVSNWTAVVDRER